MNTISSRLDIVYRILVSDGRNENGCLMPCHSSFFELDEFILCASHATLRLSQRDTRPLKVYITVCSIFHSILHLCSHGPHLTPSENLLAENGLVFDVQ